VSLRTSVFIAGFLLLVPWGPGASAQPQDSVVGISERVFKILDQAQELIDAEDFPGAREALEAGLARRTTSYERAQMLNMLGYSWYESEDLARARETYAEALAIPDLPPSMLVALNLTLGQIYLVDEAYGEAEQHFRTLLGFEDQETPGNLVLLAAALLGQEDYEGALDPVLQAIGTVEARGDLPRENWLSMLSSIYFEIGDYEAMRDVIEKLTLLYPREQYLMNLAALHGQLGDTERQLALIESLLDDGRISQPTHVDMIVNLYLGAELPHKAAVLLERELESGLLEKNTSRLELLSQAWYMSAEIDRAIGPLAQAAELSESGDLYLRLARLHMDAARWDAARDAADAALAKGGLKDEGQAWLLSGMARVRLEAFRDARKGFERAAAFDGTAKYAGQWLAYLEAEEARLAAVGN
jgi:tetratricopeptide (TPR) repeat protein